ncbi:hypothetical protein JCM19379_29560 [Methyloparacoccus murrellii]
MSGLTKKSIDAAAVIRSLIPNHTPAVSDQDLATMIGVDAHEIAELAYPDPTAEPAELVARGKRIGYLKSSSGPWFLLLCDTVAEAYSGCKLFEIERNEDIATLRDLLGNYPPAGDFKSYLPVNAWFPTDLHRLYRFAGSLPPAALCGVYPSQKQGHAALAKVHASTRVEMAALEALARHFLIISEAAQAGAVLIERILAAQPVLGAAKIRGLAHAVKEDQTDALRLEPPAARAASGRLPPAATDGLH